MKEFKMEQINFYSNGPAKHHKAIARWFYLSCIACVALIMSLASLYIQQWYIHASLASEKNSLNAELYKLDHIVHYQQNQKLLETKLEKKTDHLKNHSTKNPADLLKSIKASLKQNAHLEALSFTEKNIELKVASENTKSLVKCAQTLSQKSSYQDLHISSFESKEGNRIVGIFKC